MSRGGPGIPRRFHFKSPPLKDLAIQRFKEWSEENKGFYGGFRNWFKENGYGPFRLEHLWRGGADGDRVFAQTILDDRSRCGSRPRAGTSGTE